MLIELTEGESAYLLNVFEMKPEIQNQAGSTGEPIVIHLILSWYNYKK